MRDKHFDSATFVSELEKIAVRFNRGCKLLRMNVVASPNFLEKYETDLRLPNKLEDLVVVSILSHYFPEEYRIYTKFSVEEKIAKLSLEDQEIILLLLQDKASMLLFLQQTNLWHTREFFGNLFSKKRLNKLQETLQFKKKTQIVRKPQRKRGYHDKGSLRPLHRRGPNEYLYTTGEQYELEQRRLALEDSISFITGMIW
jgi:hypothetical protein